MRLRASKDGERVEVAASGLKVRVRAMIANKDKIVFENQRDRDIFLELLREVNVGELRPEIIMEAVEMLEGMQKGVMG